jgi:hypothetical protein
VKWRCEWCGKPHAENDPPCDNCGHSEFEKAVVPAAPEGDETTSDAYGYVWVCTECGNDHPKNTPPCDRCGHDTFERQEIEFDEDEVMNEMLGGSETSSTPSADVGYLDVLDAKLVVAFIAVVGLVVVIGLGTVGIVDLSRYGIGPSPGPVPGNATTAGSLSLAEVEAAYVSELNERRADGGFDELTRDDQIADAARFANQQRVRAAYGDGSPANEEEIGSRIGDACGGRILVDEFEVETDLDTDSTAFESERALARALLDASGRSGGAFVEPDRGRTGVDVHVAPDGTVYVLQYAC